MRTLILTILIATFVEFGTAQSLEKDVIATAGAYFDNNEIGLNWTIGQTVTGTFESPDGAFTLSQGFHTGAPLDGNAIETKPATSSGELTLYPNPAQNSLFVSFYKTKKGKISYKIYDSKGNTVMLSGEFLLNKTIEIDVENLPPGIYFFTSSFDQGKLFSRSFIKK